MATLQVTLKDGFFINNNGVYIETFSPTHVSGNGWECHIREDGSLECLAVREYSDGEHSMLYRIQKNGFGKLTLKVSGEPVKVLKKGFVVPKGTKFESGTLGLAGGYIDDRYAYFRDSSFQNFLDKHGITSVKKENPNQIYVVRNALYGGGECKSHLLTDGKKTTVRNDFGRSEKWEKISPETSVSEENRSVEVSGASWVIHQQTQHEGNAHNCFRILYTMRNPTELVGLPK